MCGTSGARTREGDGGSDQRHRLRPGTPVGIRTLDENEQLAVARSFEEAQQLLAGIEGEESTLDTDRRFGWWTQLTRSFLTMASKEEIARGQHKLMVTSSGVGPTSSDC